VPPIQIRRSALPSPFPARSTNSLSLIFNIFEIHKSIGLQESKAVWNHKMWFRCSSGGPGWMADSGHGMWMWLRLWFTSTPRKGGNTCRRMASASPSRCCTTFIWIFDLYFAKIALNYPYKLSSITKYSSCLLKKN